MRSLRARLLFALPAEYPSARLRDQLGRKQLWKQWNAIVVFMLYIHSVRVNYSLGPLATDYGATNLADESLFYLSTNKTDHLVSLILSLRTSETHRPVSVGGPMLGKSPTVSTLRLIEYPPEVNRSIFLFKKKPRNAVINVTLRNMTAQFAFWSALHFSRKPAVLLDQCAPLWRRFRIFSGIDAVTSPANDVTSSVSLYSRDA